ncbi:hypothetical protein [Klebsiella phage vB_KpnS-VAC8]|uniref:Uncharacterized protein n=1 Tax=Klebsiella phage vB_KpnS-VAC8 TaxID=2864366 RepID=A0AAE7XI00_9CAUD|nr:hypothetical protein [Klebsiella phage vB_KpnS-VAC8]
MRIAPGGIYHPPEQQVALFVKTRSERSGIISTSTTNRGKRNDYSDYLGTRKQQARSARVRDRGGLLQPGGKWWLLQGADC